VDYFRAEATRHHRRTASKWTGKWRKDLKRAIEQGRRWQLTEPFAQIHIVSTNGMKATLEEIEATEKIR
jgi:phage baseplate assembly protein gpV